MSSWGSPLLDPRKLQNNNNFFKIDWIRKKLLVDVANPATCCHDDYDVLLEVLGTLGKCYVSNPVAKTLVWIENHDWAQLFLDVFLGLTLTGPTKASKQTILHNRLNKEKTPGRCCQSGSCCHDDYDVLLEVVGTLGKCYVSNPVAKTLVWIENHDWHNCFCMSSWGSPLLDPKKLQNEQFYIIDWIRKKLLVDVANLAPCCHDDYDVLLEVLGTLRECYVSSRLGLTTFPPTRARVSGKQLGQARGLLLPRCVFPVLGSKSSGLAELFSANARAGVGGKVVSPRRLLT